MAAVDQGGVNSMKDVIAVSLVLVLLCSPGIAQTDKVDSLELPLPLFFKSDYCWGPAGAESLALIIQTNGIDCGTGGTGNQFGKGAFRSIYCKAEASGLPKAQETPECSLRSASGVGCPRVSHANPRSLSGRYET